MVEGVGGGSAIVVEVCGTGSVFAGRASVGWHELDGQKLCLLTPDMQNRRIINKSFREAGIAPEAWIESNSTVALVANVEGSDWLTVLPSDIARFLVTGKALRVIPLSGGGPDHSVGLVAPFREPHTPVLAALLAEARRMSEA